ncbi:MAG: hypothetical protein H7125_04760 [Proteobacteria bacterium]|nr:hypothetical protein [Burkholderiales bacterium]
MKHIVAVLAFSIAASAGAQQYESARDFKASQFAPAALLNGPLHTVDENVSVELGLPRFTIRSKHGTWEARGVEMLAIRVSELPAFVQLDSVSRTDEFTKAAAKALAAPVQTVGQFIQDPVETTGNMVSGLGIMAGRVGRIVGSAATRVGDMASDADPGKKGVALNRVAPEAGTAQPRLFTGDPLGYNAARREWAKRLNIDPYTSNAALADKLGRVASASFAGSLPVDLAIGAVSTPLQYANETNSTAQLQAYQLSPIDLEKANERKLTAMGIEGLPVRTLFRNRYFSPTLQTALVLALESLRGASGRGEIVAFAGRAASEIEARYVINSLVMVAQYSRSVAPITALRSAENVIAAQTRDGKLVVPAPLDYIAWVQPAEDFARRTDLKGSERSLLLSGTASKRAKQELSARGWRVNETPIVAAR